MSGGSPSGYREVSAYIDLFNHVIGCALACGVAGDWNKLQRRLDALSVRLKADEAVRGRSKAPEWAYRLEREIWIDELTEDLHPPILVGLVEALADEAEAVDPRVWAPLDVAAFSEETKRRRRREAWADAAVLAALRHYRSNPKHARIVEGMRALEELHDARVSTDPVWEVDVLRKEARRLADALTEMLPPSVRLALSSWVDDLFRSELEGKPVDQLEPAQGFCWHHKVPGLGFWYPAWRGIRFQGGHPEVSGTWFVPELQAEYEATWKPAEKNSSLDPHPATQDKTEGPRSNPVGQEQEPDAARSQVREESGGLDEAAVRQDAKSAPAGPEIRRATPEETSIAAEERLRAWCQSQGITPKHLTAESRVRMMMCFATEVGADKK